MGYFITFEGIEGCGKTTQIKRAAQSLREAGHRVVVTREPGGCPIADDIRAILLDAGNSAMVPTTELLLYAAARAQHVAEVIAPALAEGAVVLCDRFTDSTLVYQGFGRNLDRDLIARLNTLAAGQIGRTSQSSSTAPWRWGLPGPRRGSTPGRQTGRNVSSGNRSSFTSGCGRDSSPWPAGNPTGSP